MHLQLTDTYDLITDFVDGNIFEASLTLSHGGGGGAGGIVSFEAETLYTADNNEVTIEVNAGDIVPGRGGQKGSDGKVYGNYLPLSFPSSQPTASSEPSFQPTEKVRILLLFYFKIKSVCPFVYAPTDYRLCKYLRMCIIIYEKPYLTVFVTSAAYMGNLGGVSGADSKCQYLANEAKLDGTFRAWISSGSISPAQSWSTPAIDLPYYLADGTTKVADDWNHLFNANNYELHHAIDQNENGETVTEALRAWTNTNWNGNRASTDDCDGWSRSGSNWQGKYGYILDKDHYWSWKGAVNCDWEIRLYCIQQNTSA